MSLSSTARLVALLLTTPCVAPAQETPRLAEVPPQTARVGEPFFLQLYAENFGPGAALQFSAAQKPEGATVEPRRGYISWTPQVGERGVHPFRIVVTDLNTARAVQGQITIAVEDAQHDPVIEPIGDRFAEPGRPLRLRVAAHDPDGDTLAFSASGLPPGASFDPATRVFEWTPAGANQTTYDVQFVVRDARGGVAAHPVRFTINSRQAPPSFALPRVELTVREGEALEFHATAADPNGDPVRYTSPTLPAGAALDPSTGRFRWTPRLGLGDRDRPDTTVTLTVVADDQGNSAGRDSVTAVIRVVGVPTQERIDFLTARYSTAVEETHGDLRFLAGEAARLDRAAQGRARYKKRLTITSGVLAALSAAGQLLEGGTTSKWVGGLSGFGAAVTAVFAGQADDPAELARKAEIYREREIALRASLDAFSAQYPTVPPVQELTRPAFGAGLKALQLAREQARRKLP